MLDSRVQEPALFIGGCENLCIFTSLDVKVIARGMQQSIYYIFGVREQFSFFSSLDVHVKLHACDNQELALFIGARKKFVRNFLRCAM